MPATAITTPPVTSTPAEAGDVVTPATGNDAVITLTGEDAYRWNLGAVAFSYNGTPTGGRIRVQQTNAAGTVVESTVLDLDVTTAGLTVLDFGRGKAFASGKGFKVTLDGASGVAGKLSIISKWKYLN